MNERGEQRPHTDNSPSLEMEDPVPDQTLRFTLGERTYDFPDPQTLTFAEIEALEAAFDHKRTFEEIALLWIRGSVRATRLFAQIALARAGNHDEARALQNLTIGELSLHTSPPERPTKTTRAKPRKASAPAAAETPAKE